MGWVREDCRVFILGVHGLSRGSIVFTLFFGVILVGEVHIRAKITREAHPYPTEIETGRQTTMGVPCVAFSIVRDGSELQPFSTRRSGGQASTLREKTPLSVVSASCLLKWKHRSISCLIFYTCWVAFLLL